ncbi:hypothetical protein [Pseudaminobacter sp. NGMCC 1.201702]|uniref:hypothetical protein n=1 Tax=Pseudaminobacter sp. NGMCC 1.201702 TaxID=3391825 RepID=UPI0039EEF18A
MFRKIKIAVVSAILGLGTLAAVPATAQADNFYFGISSHGPSFGYHGAGYGHGYGWDRRDCTPRKALRKAQRIGVHRAHIRSVNRHTIRVSGRKHGHRINVTFAKAPHCPIIR